MSLFRKTILDLSRVFDARVEAYDRMKEQKQPLSKQGPDVDFDANLKFRKTCYEHIEAIDKELKDIESLGILIRDYKRELLTAIEHQDWDRRNETRAHLAKALSLIKDIEPLISKVKKDSKLLE